MTEHAKNTCIVLQLISIHLLYNCDLFAFKHQPSSLVPTTKLFLPYADHKVFWEELSPPVHFCNARQNVVSGYFVKF